MSYEKKMEMLAEVLDLDVSEFNEETNLDDLAEWDSVAALTFIAMMDEEFKKEIKGADIKKFKTIKDILEVMEE